MLLYTRAIFVFYLIQGCLSVYVEVMPREIVALPKQNATFLCKVGVPIQYCRIEIPSFHPFNLNPNLPPTNGVVYHGAGLQAGQCGATIDSLKEENNGPVKCSMGIATESRESSTTMSLTVAKAPKTPELDLSRGTDSLKVYRVGDMLQASCIVKDGRPAANISWFLDEEPIYDNLGMVTIVDNAKEDLYSIVQNFTRKLRSSDNGKQLRCVAVHPALSSHNNEVSRQLDIKYQPLPHDNPIDKFGYELGKAGIITVDIYANPRPQLEWVVGDEHIKEGNVDSTGRLEAQASRDEGRGHYVATLRIASISKQDTETQFRLIAYNDQGTTEYYVVISTSPEPEAGARYFKIYGLELGIGYIVGIVVAILVLLLAIFLIVYARATGRWCFSGGAHVIDYTQGGDTGVRSGVNPTNDGVDNPHHQSSQEYINGRNQTTRHAGETSSDTESTVAEVRQRESKLKAPRLSFSNVFKKNKDKVTHEEETARNMELDEPKVQVQDVEKQHSDKPEGIVYAELDLVAQNLRPMVKNDDDKTEYAEIIYTQKPESETEQTPAQPEVPKTT